MLEHPHRETVRRIASVEVGVRDLPRRAIKPILSRVAAGPEVGPPELPVAVAVQEVELVDRDGAAKAPQPLDEAPNVKLPVPRQALGPQEVLVGDGLPAKGVARQDEAIDALLRPEVGAAAIEGAAVVGRPTEDRLTAVTTPLLRAAEEARVAVVLVGALPLGAATKQLPGPATPAAEVAAVPGHPVAGAAVGKEATIPRHDAGPPAAATLVAPTLA